MRGGVSIWALGIAASVLVHLGAGAALLAALAPEPVEDQPTPSSRLQVEAQEVTRSEANEQAPSADAVEDSGTAGAAVASGAIAQSTAAALTVPVEGVTAQDPQRLAEPATALQQDVATTAAAAPQAASLTPQAPVQVAAVSSAPTPVAARPTNPIPVALASNTPAAATAPQTTPEPAIVTQSRPEATPTAQVAPPSVPTEEQVPNALASKAVLAFPGQDSTIDPQSLAAFQSFTQPGTAEGTDLRDSVSAALSLPCSRMQVIFDPESTTLRLTGHVPEDDLRAPLVSTLQAQMGADIAISDELLILPAPQCSALSGIARIGLPQSTDQITNPLIVGEDTHARAFRYAEGQALVLDMTGADYPAYVYVDYFDAAGNVIHLTPNDRAPLRRVDAEAPLQIGARQADEPGLFVKIGPPYGQEIAAAFAASVPLYDGLRPLIEPADAYLEWMRDRVAEARAAHPDFKGEWVYFFVTTSPE